MNRYSAAHRNVLAGLKLRWMIFTMLCLLFLAAGYLFLTKAWQPIYALRWLALASPVVIYLVIVFGHNLAANHPPDSQKLRTSLGWGNKTTLTRGVLTAGLVGFLFSPQPEGWLAWAPGILYTLICAADFLDGFLARITNHTTVLGEILDMSFDGLGVLAAAGLAVQYEQVPAWYLLVALARPIFLVGLWLRNRLHKPIYNLMPSIARRLNAGLQMGFLAFILFPVFTPPGTWIAATYFAIPFLVGFSYDWLFASGAIKSGYALTEQTRWPIAHWLPVALRIIVLLISLPYLFDSFQNFSSLPGNQVLLTLSETLIILLVVIGITPRGAAIAGLVILGIHQVSTSLTTSQLLLGAAYTGILFMGSGALSIWTPEEFLVFHRAGEQSRT